jgi:hypothetical protein
MPNRLHLFLLCLLLGVPLCAAPMPWTQLKVGMAADEIITLLGDPILRSVGRGFETWTYDDGAEVLIYGLVVGWTTPASATTSVRSQDVWRDKPRGEYFATLRAAVRKAAPKAPVIPVAKLPARETRPAAHGMGYEEYASRG